MNKKERHIKKTKKLVKILVLNNSNKKIKIYERKTGKLIIKKKIINNRKKGGTKIIRTGIYKYRYIYI